MAARKPTTLEYALLGLLHQQPKSGYDLRKIFETTAMGNYSGSPGAIYPALKRLEAQALIEGEVDSSTELRPKKMFRPTDEGMEVLRAWLTLDIGRADVERRLDELMLRFAFHYLLASAKETRRFLDALLRQLEAYIDELERQAKSFPEQAPPHPRLALAAGIEQYRACARWARGAARHFGEESR